MASAQLRHTETSIKALSTNRPTTAVAENAAFMAQSDNFLADSDNSSPALPGIQTPRSRHCEELDTTITGCAFAARISDIGAELGVATAKAFRGRGYATAAVAGCSKLPTLQSRELFYSTDGSNVSSQRVAARLGLGSLGASLRLS